MVDDHIIVQGIAYPREGRPEEKAAFDKEQEKQLKRWREASNRYYELNKLSIRERNRKKKKEVKEGKEALERFMGRLRR